MDAQQWRVEHGHQWADGRIHEADMAYKQKEAGDEKTEGTHQQTKTVDVVAAAVMLIMQMGQVVGTANADSCL